MLSEEERKFIETHVDGIVSIEAVSGGLVHEVYKIRSEKKNYFLKIRKSSSSKVEGIETRESEIVFEEEALRFFSKEFRNLFPSPMACDPKIGALLMSEALMEGTPIIELLKLENKASVRVMVKNLGSSLGRIHLYSRHKYERVKYNENNDFDQILRFRYGCCGIAALDEMIAEISQGKDFVILGGLSPKNILANGCGNIAFVDLETSCPGNNVFDFAFCIAHVMLHNIGNKMFSKELFELFLTEYNKFIKIDGDSKNMKRMILGTYLYRLDNKNVPYPLKLDVALKKKTVKKIRGLLSQRDIRLENIFV
jgi:hypothetical protein